MADAPAPGNARPGSAPLWFLAVFGALWCTLTIAFDVMAVRGLYRQCRAANSFTPVPATVISSRIDESSDSEGTSYTPVVTYRYSVGGRTYTGERYSFGLSPGGHAFASRVVNSHPPGAATTVHVDPADPAVAVLDPVLRGWHVYVLVFLAPFNAAMLLGAGAAWRRLRARAGAGAIVLDDDGRRAVLRPSEISPAGVGVAVFGAVGFVLSFGMIFWGGSISVEGASALLGVTLACGVLAGVKTAAASRRGDYDLVLDRVGGRLRLTAGQARKAGAREILAERVQRVEVQPQTTESDGDRTTVHHVRLVVDGTPGGAPLTLASWKDAARAAQLQRWLAVELGRPCDAPGAGGDAA